MRVGTIDKERTQIPQGCEFYFRFHCEGSVGKQSHKPLVNAF